MFSKLIQHKRRLVLAMMTTILVGSGCNGYMLKSEREFAAAKQAAKRVETIKISEQVPEDLENQWSNMDLSSYIKQVCTEKLSPSGLKIVDGESDAILQVIIVELPSSKNDYKIEVDLVFTTSARLCVGYVGGAPPQNVAVMQPFAAQWFTDAAIKDFSKNLNDSTIWRKILGFCSRTDM
jgi:hypothetical protein